LAHLRGKRRFSHARSPPFVYRITLFAAVIPFLRAADDTTRLLRFPPPTAKPSSSPTPASSTPSPPTVAPPAACGCARLRYLPALSADGAQLAFTAQYDGNTEVYVMPATGGTPKRLTTSATLDRDDLADRMGPNNVVFGWRNTAAEVVFRSRWHSFNPFIGQLYTVGLDGDVPTQLPVPAAASSPIRPTTRRSPTTASSVNSAPGNNTRAAWPTTSGSSI